MKNIKILVVFVITFVIFEVIAGLNHDSLPAPAEVRYWAAKSALSGLIALFSAITYIKETGGDE